MDDSRGRQRLLEVYMEGLADITPSIPPRFEELERAALDAMTEEAHAYVAGSAGSENTARRNTTAFERWHLVPRMLRDVAERDLSTDLLESELDAPALLAPIGVQSIIHEEAELAVARAANDVGMPFVLSTVSSYTMEEVAAEAPDVPKWFQLYWSPVRELAQSFVSRAEDAGFEALVVTVDTPLVGWRERDIEHAYLPFLDGEGIANYVSDDVFLDRLDAPPEENQLATVKEFLDVFGDASLTWDDLEWLTDQTELPVVVKGILHPDDARAAFEHGAEAVVVSNHGGRQVDGSIAAIDALPRVRDAVGDDATLLFDSGIRRGAQAIKALALGADSVLLGRPYAYGLALEGQEGVAEVCKNFLADFDITLGLTGHKSPDELSREALVEDSEL
ncbi:alpha-hydroxy-acid oxidizing protein [Natronomonas sp. EA1]|uniref:alpha-hydroxy-acid oxidizing protein n=1 Tax=Natronomonas sp. EA1 TaxID=3421655 RepID=UPI003EC05FBE